MISNAAQLNWNNTAGAVGYEIRGRILEGSWVNLLIEGGNIVSRNVFGLQPSTQYEWRIRTWCDIAGTVKSNYTYLDTFATSSFSRLSNLSDPFDTVNMENQVVVYPNPASSSVLLLFSKPMMMDEVIIELYDASGKMLSVEIAEGDQLYSLKMNLKHLSNGVYQLVVRGDHYYHFEKLVKVN